MCLLLLLLASCAATLSHALHGDGPVLDGLKGQEIKFAKLYWDYDVISRVQPTSPPDGNDRVKLGYDFMIPLAERMAGITYVGHAARLRLALERARNGERLRIGALGGSITAGHGVGGMDYSYVRYFMDWLSTAMPPGPNARPPLNGNSTRHDVLNGAVPGTVSDYTSSCVNNHLIPEADIVFVEFAINDTPVSIWNLDGAIARRPFERLLRKLLRAPSKPAIVVVNQYAVAPAGNKYHHTAERDFTELAVYYSMSAVSLKAAVLPSGIVGGSDEVLPGAIFNGGAMHPGRGGHVVVVELLITMFTELLRQNSLAGQPGFLSFKELQALATRPIPPPICEGNYESSIDTCYIEDQLQKLVQQPVTGWNWTDEGRGKWGYVSMDEGDSLKIKISTRLEGKRSDKDASAEIILQIAYLQSYRGMSSATVECVEGCTCDEVTIDAFDRRPVSVTAMRDIQVSQHPKCTLKVTNVGPSELAVAKGSTSGYKFKLIGLVVGEEPGAESGAFDHVRMVSMDLKKKMHGKGKKILRRNRRQ